MQGRGSWEAHTPSIKDTVYCWLCCCLLVKRCVMCYKCYSVSGMCVCVCVCVGLSLVKCVVGGGSLWVQRYLCARC